MFEDDTFRMKIADIEMTPDPSGALYWAAERMLIVADLHLEKGSTFAARGQMLPPYDTHATLARLEAACARHRPARWWRWAILSMTARPKVGWTTMPGPA